MLYYTYAIIVDCVLIWVIATRYLHIHEIGYI